MYNHIENIRILLVGAGGIGCEILKNLVLMGITRINIVDLDTIDHSNLNRQFLFQREHIQQPKSLIAKQSVEKHYCSLKQGNFQIIAHHGDIKNTNRFSVFFFEQFDLVLNALDNLDARRHVGYMCHLSGKPCIESGTAGYLGQVYLIIPGRTECFSCQPKPVPTVFPVCTIRSMPTTLIHCVVWAKDYLFAHIFNQEQPKDDYSSDPNITEIQEILLRSESMEWNELMKNIHSSTFAIQVAQKVFDRDISRLQSLEEIWKGEKQPPSPLSCYLDINTLQDHECINTENDITIPTLNTCLYIWIQSLNALIQRRNSESIIIFDKDDDQIMNFVAYSANIRAHLFSIPKDTRFKIKAIAGNIIPAIATTNSVIAGLACLYTSYLCNHLGSGSDITLEKNDPYSYATYYVPTRQDNIMFKEKLLEPNPSCNICSRRVIIANLNTNKCTLGRLLDAILDNKELSVMESSRLLYDPDFTSNSCKLLSDLSIFHTNVLHIIEENDSMTPTFCIIYEENEWSDNRIEIKIHHDYSRLEQESKRKRINDTQE